ncbi:ATP-binding cassette domain-containing protein [Blastococcus sp. KM273128]|uniref:ABC transporter ATP-binding protein n=1 Tax=Blastococcus sp. KM273128 TaxID=2570314 RepID=UPI001F00C917|nr:ATP-binding cassette domain-containing protein [Blastococcus sp. KM273128]MCF6743343.1 ATP-binding cassette domain-containing protein [Blastococcus sp. KM273128]
MTESSPGGAEPPALSLHEVACRYGSRTVLAPLTLRLAPGAVCAVGGANGAGKTTLLRIAAGLVEPTSGSRSVSGRALYLRPGAGMRRRQRAVEAVAFAGALAGRPEPAVSAAAALASCGLPEELWRQETGRLSAGQQTRVTLAVARVVSPAVVCLDEPMEHLDAEGRAAVRATVAALAGRGTAVLVAGPEAAHHLGPADARLELAAGAVTVLG